MNNFDQRVSGASRSSAVILAVFAVGFFLCFLPLVFWSSIAHDDEVFQAIEQGHRLVFGYGLVPWEFDYAARSWLLAYIVAGAMEVSRLLGGGPSVYLPMITATLSALAALSTVCAFLWTRRFYGTTAAGIAAALVSASWIDNMYFGGRSMSETVSAHLLIIAVYLAEPGFRVRSRRRLLLAGFFAGAAVMFRIQLAPAIAVLWIWRGLDARRLALLSIGAVVAIVLDGAFDAATWHYPFEPLWLNIRFNLLQHGSDHFGLQPWWKYFYWMGANWGGTIALFLPLAFLGARRMPLLLVMAAVIVLAHSAIGHKEYRFIYPALLMLSILAGLGLVDGARLLAHGWRDAGRNAATIGIATTLALCWALLVLVNFIGRDYEKDWDRDHASTQAALFISTMPHVCGVGLNRVGAYEMGGYTYLHRRVPLYWSNNDPRKVMAKAPAFNVMLYKSISPEVAPPPTSPYKKVACFDDVCVMRRPGGCRAMPMPKPRLATMGVDVVDNYPYVAGVEPSFTDISSPPSNGKVIVEKPFAGSLR